MDNCIIGGLSIYIVDAQMGVSGDMLLAALVDLDMIPKRKYLKVLETIGNVWVKTKVNALDDNFYSFNGKKLEFNFQFKPPKSGLPATELVKYFELGIEEIGLSKGKSLAKKILDTLLSAEVKVHKCTLEELHLHETGSPDTLIDILGFVYFWEKENVSKDKLITTPISVGQGIWKTSHGFFSVPPPAALEILKNMQFRYGPIDGELATPTGLAILKNVVYEYIDYIQDVSIVPKKVGYGLGSRLFEDYINILRIIYG